MTILIFVIFCCGALPAYAQDKLAKETPHNRRYIANLQKQILMDRMGAGEVRIAPNGDIVFPDARGRQTFLYAVGPTKAVYRLSLGIVRSEKLSQVRNVFQGMVIKKDGLYRAGGVAGYEQLKRKLDTLPANDFKTRLALANTGWRYVQREPWVFFKPPIREAVYDDKVRDAFIVNLQKKRPVSAKYNMAAEVDANGDIFQTDGRGFLTFQYALNPFEAVYLLSPETAGDLNFPSENAFKGFLLKSKGIYTTGFLLDYIYPEEKETNSVFMKAYSDRLNGEENINWKKLSREPWFFYHKDPKTNAALNQKFITKLKEDPISETFDRQTVTVSDNGDLYFKSLDASVYFCYALSSDRAIYQISQAYAERRGFYSTNVFFGVIIKKDEVYTASSRFVYEEPANREDEGALRLFDERRKSVYNIDWERPVSQPWMIFRRKNNL